MSAEKWKFSDGFGKDEIGERLIQSAIGMGVEFQRLRRLTYTRLLGLPDDATDQQIIDAIFDLWANGEKLVERWPAGADIFGCGSKALTIEVVKMDLQ